MSIRAALLAEKLLRLAAPSSGAPEAERSAAALRAAQIIAEHGLVVQAREAVRPSAGSRASSGRARDLVRPRAEPRREPRTTTTTPTNDGLPWIRCVAFQYGTCGSCGKEIKPTDRVWIRGALRPEFRHDFRPCSDQIDQGVQK